MPTLPWCVGPIGAGGTPQSSEIPQPPPDSESNDIETQESSASDSSSGSLDSCRFFVHSYAAVCKAPGDCDPLIEEVLGVFSRTSVEEVNRAVINSINNRTLSWKAGSNSLVRESFSEVLTNRISPCHQNPSLRCLPIEWGSCLRRTQRGVEARMLRGSSSRRWKKRQPGFPLAEGKGI